MRYLVWDFDGTLAYRAGMWTQACVDVLCEEANPEITEKDVRPHLQEGFPWHTPDRSHSHISTADEWWEELYPVLIQAIEANDVKPSQSRELVEKVRSTYIQEDWELYEDTIPALDQLSSRGYTHFILSNHIPELDSIVERLGLSDFFEEIFNSAYIGYEKPHTEAFRPVIDQIEDDAEVWMIGDSMSADINGASSVGLNAILVRGTHSDADYSCFDLSLISDVLDGR